MIVNMILVKVCRDHHLKSISPHFVCQLHTDFVGDIRRNFTHLEALISVPRNIFIVFSVLLFGQNHLLQGDFFPTVDSVHILIGSFIRAADVFKNVEEILRSFRHGLFRILYIIYEVAQSSLDMPK